MHIYDFKCIVLKKDCFQLWFGWVFFVGVQCLTSALNI